MADTQTRAKAPWWKRFSSFRHPSPTIDVAAQEPPAPAFQTLFGAPPTPTPPQVAGEPPPAFEALCQITFGKDGNDSNYLGIGWSGDEAGFRWTIGTVSEIWLEHPGAGQHFRVEFDFSPHVNPPALLSQRVVVRVRGQAVARSTLKARRPYAFAIPGALLAGPGPVRIVIEHPDARSPRDYGAADGRQLGLCMRQLLLYRVNAESCGDDLEAGRGLTIAEVEQKTGMSAADFISGFESLGDNCEFGLVQRRCGAEPLSLFRFASAQLPNVLRALETRFATVGDLEMLEFSVVLGEYVIREKSAGFTYHTWMKEGTVDERSLLTQQSKRLKFLARKLTEDLTEATKIFVWKRNAGATEGNARAMHAAIRAYGPATLLWVMPADEDHPLGSVEQIAPGLLRANIERFAPSQNAHDLILDMWLDICVKAHHHVRHALSRFGMQPPA